MVFQAEHIHLNLKVTNMPAQSQHIVIADQVHPHLMERLDKEDIPYVYSPDCKASEIRQLLKNALGLVIRSKAYVNKDLLGNARPLFIARAGSGMDNLDEEYLNDLGIHLMNAPEGNKDAVAEQTIGMLLDLAANITKGNLEVRSGKWDREGNRGFELGGRTIGIIGYGNCGSAVAKKLSGFGMQVLGYDKYKSGFSNEYVTESNMDEIFNRSDIVSFHIPLTEETTGLINADYVRKFRKDIVLLNLSRGKIMKTDDLLNLLDEGKLKGLALDVLENENLKILSERENVIFENLNRRNNVVITPHIGGWTQESYLKISKILADKILEFLTKKKKNEKEIHEIVGKV